MSAFQLGRILSMILGFIAFILSAVTASGCAFLTLSGDLCYNQLGLFKYNNAIQCIGTSTLYSGCTKYSNIDVSLPYVILHFCPASQ